MEMLSFGGQGISISILQEEQEEYIIRYIIKNRKNIINFIKNIIKNRKNIEG